MARWWGIDFLVILDNIVEDCNISSRVFHARSA
jgi:hypothetical protein